MRLGDVGSLVKFMSEQQQTFKSGDGAELHDFCAKLFPICRSITGDGVRETLNYIRELIPLEVLEVKSGTSVFDWNVPLEWNFREAFIEDEYGKRLVDTANSNLHVVQYSEAIDQQVSLDCLQEHLYSIPEYPERIPYRTSYYQKQWGFCLSENQRRTLRPGNYRVRIDAKLQPGVLTYGEFFLPGRQDKEIVISTHICHPSLANDNLSGIAVTAELARRLAALGRGHYGLRFIFIPGTIGSVTWLAQNESRLAQVASGLVLSGLGDRGELTYKESKAGSSELDRALSRAVLKAGGTVRPYHPYGYDERQFNSPGIDIPTGCLMRTPYGEYDEYHSSADNLSFISANSLESTVDVVEAVFTSIQSEPRYLNLTGKGEPQLGKRGLYSMIGGDNQEKHYQLAMFWLLAYSDGNHSLLDIAELSEIDYDYLDRIANKLITAGLLQLLGG